MVIQATAALVTSLLTADAASRAVGALPGAFTGELFEAVLIMGKGAPTCDNDGL
jgi:hypothetical protein